MKSKIHPTYKTKYRVANWAAYNQALVRRGDVTVWLSSEAIAAWTPRRSGRRGGQRRYSDLAIETALTLRLGIVKLTKSSSINPQDGGLEPVVNPPCWASETAVSLTLTVSMILLPVGVAR